MSKTKFIHESDVYSHTDYLHKKAKHRTSSRRKTNANIKHQRMKSVKQYGYGAGYYIVDTKYEHKKEPRNVPEKQVPITHWERIKTSYWDEKAQKYKTIEDFKLVTDGYKTIPAHTKMVIVETNKKSIKPHLKRCHINKKWYRNHAARKVRRTPIDTNINNSNYKKFFDIKWAIW